VQLHEIRVYFESDDEGLVAALQKKFERSICPHEATSRHRCPNRWFVIHSLLDADEAARVEDLLND
jgi:hypothetical protein